MLRVLYLNTIVEENYVYSLYALQRSKVLSAESGLDYWKK